MSSNDTNGTDAYDRAIRDDIIICSYAILMGLGLIVAYAITITRFGLWHTNAFLDKIPKLVNNPIAHALTVVVGLVTAAPYANDVVIIWLVVLAIVFDNVKAIANSSLLERGADWLSVEGIFLYNCVFIGTLVIIYSDSVYYGPLIALWCFLVIKFLVRLFNYKVADRAYGVKDTNLVADYMETEHTLSDQRLADPQSMKGYKYLVVGEERAPCMIQPPEYTLGFDKTKDEIVTLESVWDCNTRILDPTIDKDGTIKDLCISFALFKLIRRRFFGFPARESQELKTKRFVFEGLLSRDKERVFRVIKTEIGFLRDVFYTRYPVAFALGFPVFNVLILIATVLISIWISAKVFHQTKEPDEFYYLIVNHTNVDYQITNCLLWLIIVTEAFEALSYVFSDWMKVMMICSHVRSKRGTIRFVDQILSLLMKLRFSTSLRNTIGQYSLLKSYNKGAFKRVTNNLVYHTTFTVIGSKLPRGMKADKEIVLPEEVQEAIFNALKASEGNFDNRMAALRRCGVAEDLSWLASLRTPILTIMVWHIATSVCEICPIKNQQIIEEDTKCFRRNSKKIETETTEELNIKPYRLAASSLSKYCTYLVVFSPELLPTTTSSSRRIFDHIVEETLDYFKGMNGSRAQYEKMMECAEENGERVIDMGAKLGRYLMNIPDDIKRWKVMAEVWSELILYLAPYGQIDGHLKHLSDGGEFITHLWALLYHAGIGASASHESIF